jgi:hypothetical protein
MKLKKTKLWQKNINNAKVFNSYSYNFLDEMQEDLIFCDLFCGM